MSGAYESAVYDPFTLQLKVRFKDGSEYTYHSVSPKTWGEMQRAPSKGKFLQHVIRAAHRMTK